MKRKDVDRKKREWNESEIERLVNELFYAESKVGD